MAVLTSEQKSFIVIHLARYESAGEVRKAFREAFGIEIEYQQVDNYNPLRPDYRQAAKWKGLFEQERARFLADVSSIPCANQAVRIEMLSAAAKECARKGNIALMNATLEQISKELGGLYTNRREVKSESKVTYEDRTADELRAEILAEMRDLGLDTDAVEGLGLGAALDDGSVH
jgi:hypothetical protein